MCERYCGASQHDEYARALATGRWVYNNYPGQPRLHEAGCYHIGAGRSGILNYEKIVCANDIDCILKTSGNGCGQHEDCADCHLS